MNLEPHLLAPLAFECMFKRQPVVIDHPAGWVRPTNWPLPIERNKVPAEDGSITQSYRPMVIFEFCEDVLKARQAELNRMLGL